MVPMVPNATKCIREGVVMPPRSTSRGYLTILVITTIDHRCSKHAYVIVWCHDEHILCAVVIVSFLVTIAALYTCMQVLQCIVADRLQRNQLLDTRWYHASSMQAWVPPSRTFFADAWSCPQCSCQDLLKIFTAL